MVITVLNQVLLIKAKPTKTTLKVTLTLNTRNIIPMAAELTTTHTW